MNSLPLDEFITIREKVFAYFGYVEDWRVLPISDSRKYYWRLEGDGPGNVKFADSIEELDSGEGNSYENEIYTNRHLPKWVYRGTDYTMVVVDTHCDGNQLLQIFSNDKESKS